MGTPVLYFGGLFNYTDPIFGIQIYIWTWGALLFLAICAWVGFRYGMWDKYKPLWGLFGAIKAGTQAAFIFNMGLISELMSERDAKCIFDYSTIKYTGLSWVRRWFFNYATVFLPNLPPTKAIVYKFAGVNMDVQIAKKLQNYDWENYSSVTVGGVHTDIILDADRWTVRDSPQHKLIEQQCDTHNEANPDDQIHAYSKYMRYIMEKKLPLPVGVLDYIIIPWSRIDSSFPISKVSSETEGANRQFAKEAEEADNNSLSKYYFPILMGGFAFAFILLLVRVIIHYVH